MLYDSRFEKEACASAAVRIAPWGAFWRLNATQVRTHSRMLVSDAVCEGVCDKVWSRRRRLRYCLYWVLSDPTRLGCSAMEADRRIPTCRLPSLPLANDSRTLTHSCVQISASTCNPGQVEISLAANLHLDQMCVHRCQSFPSEQH